MTSPLFPEAPPSRPPTPLPELDRLLDRLSTRKDAWAQLGIPQRIAFLEAAREGVQREASAWARTMSSLKGLSPEENLHGEDWLAGPMNMARNIRLLIDALRAGGQPKPPKLRQRGDQWIAEVLPAAAGDRLALPGWRGEVWMQPGKPPSQGRIYRERAGEGRVALVLGAGNVTSIGPMDVLYKLFVENEVCILKMNPVNEVAGPHIERFFAALIEAGYLAVAYGGAEVGRHLTDHPLVGSIHITGSDRTHDLIIWGDTPAEQQKNKAAATPRLAKPMTSELGNVTPVLVVPGPWSDSDLDYHAHSVAGMVTQNASFNCTAAKVIVTARGWELRDRFLTKLAGALAGAQPRKAYYPGAQDRYEKFLDSYPQAKAVGGKGDGIVPWTLIPDVPAQQGEHALANEAFCGVLAETSIDTNDPAEFLARAVPFVNDSVWGTLNCMVLVHPETQKQLGELLDQAIEGLRYGAVTVNGWTSAIYALTHLTWGAYPGHSLDDIQSGRGVVHNTMLFDHPQKSVVFVPFRVRPIPVWFPNHKNLRAVGERAVRFEHSASLLRYAGLVAEAIKA
jgi:acyl-CoA reductase-like NAD-dependent aldehyde dehydrogenase